MGGSAAEFSLQFSRLTPCSGAHRGGLWCELHDHAARAQESDGGADQVREEREAGGRDVDRAVHVQTEHRER